MRGATRQAGGVSPAVPASVPAPMSAPGPARVGVHPLEAGDLPRVLALEQAVHGRRGWSAATFRSEIAREDREYVVAVNPASSLRSAPSDLLGYAGSADVAGDLHIATVVVSPDARRRGVASRLLSHLLHSAATRGMTAATLEVGASNVAARELYRRFGFAPVGLRPGYYDPALVGAPGEDAVIMWRHDLDLREGDR